MDFATDEEILLYMEQKGFRPVDNEGNFENNEFMLSDIRPKNVLVSYSGAIVVIDAEVARK